MLAKSAKRTKAQRQADMNSLARLYVKGTPQTEIARSLGISQGQVSNDLRSLLKEWEDSRINDINRYKHEQLLRINMIEEEMWEAWRISKTKGKTTINMSKSGEFVDSFDTTLGRKVKKDEEKYWRAGSTEEQPVAGDMQYMNGVMWCVQERTKILGLNAPKKIANTDPTGEHEAGATARDILNDIIGGILKKAEPEEKDFVEGQLVEHLGDDNTVEVGDEDVPELAKKLRSEALRRLPSASGIMLDADGAIITSSVDVADEDEVKI